MCTLHARTQSKTEFFRVCALKILEQHKKRIRQYKRDIYRLRTTKIKEHTDRRQFLFCLLSVERMCTEHSRITKKFPSFRSPTHKPQDTHTKTKSRHRNCPPYECLPSVQKQNNDAFNFAWGVCTRLLFEHQSLKIQHTTEKEQGITENPY